MLPGMAVRFELEEKSGNICERFEVAGQEILTRFCQLSKYDKRLFGEP
jgi:hypothetical protein